jgi:hypothetical protein
MNSFCYLLDISVVDSPLVKYEQIYKHLTKVIVLDELSKSFPF